MIRLFAIVFIFLSTSSGPVVLETDQDTTCINRDPTFLTLRYLNYYCENSSEIQCRDMVGRASRDFSDVKIFELTEPDVVRAYIYIPEGGVYEADDGSGDITIVLGTSTVIVDFNKSDCSVMTAYWE